MSRPSFLVIGAQKAGTTWLEKNLGEHPEVITPRFKELHYFDKAEGFERGIDWYESQFNPGAAKTISGEFTPNYFWIPSTTEEAQESGQLERIPERIHEYEPEIRLILTLRNPVERAVSAYYHHIRARRVKPDERLSDVAHRFGIRSMGEYGRILKEWLRVFPLEQFMILNYEEDIVGNPVTTYRRLCSFLGIDDSFLPAGIRRRRFPRNSHFLLRLNHQLPPLARCIQKYWPGFGSSWKRYEIAIQREEIIELENHYKADVQQLEQLIGKEMNWMKKEDASRPRTSGG